MQKNGPISKQHKALSLFHSINLVLNGHHFWGNLPDHLLDRLRTAMDYIGEVRSTDVESRKKRIFANLVLRQQFLLTTMCLFFLVPIISLNTIALLNAKMAADDYCVKLQIQTLGLWDSYFASIWSGTPTFFSNYFTYLRLNFLSLNGLFLTLLYISSVALVACLIERILMKNSTRVKTLLFSLSIAALLINFNLMIPRGNEGAAFISTYGWSTARVIGLNLLIILLLNLRSSNPRATAIKYFILLALIGTDSALAVTAIGIVFFFSNSSKDKSTHVLSKNRVIASVFLVIEIASQLTPGQFSRRRALDIGMREGAPVNFDAQAFNVGKYNLYRLTHESFDLKMCFGILFLGIFTALIFDIKTNQVNDDLRILFLATLIGGIFTVVASVIAYLQTWHFIALNMLFSFLLFNFGVRLGINLKSHYKTKLGLTIIVIFIVMIIGLNSILTSKKYEDSSQIRSYKFETRSELNFANDIPLFSLSGLSITEDLKSDWVRECYVGLFNE
jgi:hypothetical protein